jgi:hypothetical protein
LGPKKSGVLHFALCTLHYDTALFNLHPTLLNSALHTLHSLPLHFLRRTLCILHSALLTLIQLSLLCTLTRNSALPPHSSIRCLTPPSSLFSLHSSIVFYSALYTLHSALCTLLTSHSAFFTSHSTFHMLRSSLRTLRSAL